MPFPTVQEHIDQLIVIRAYCSPCHHNETVDLEALGQKLGFDFRISHDSLVPLLRCTKCGSKDVTIRRHDTHRRGVKFDTFGRLMDD